MHSENSSPWLFFTLTYGLSWLFWIPAALSGRAEPELPVLVLHYLGGLMLPLVAVGLVYLSRDRQVRLDYWQRVIDFRCIGAKWYAIILLTVPLLTTLAALLDLLLGGVGGGIEAAVRSLPHPLMIIPFAVFTLLFGPLPEELAWRGYVLDRLQARQNPLAASLIIGVAWTLWHLPLVFIRGSYQHGLGIGSLSFWLYSCPTKCPNRFS